MKTPRKRFVPHVLALLGFALISLPATAQTRPPTLLAKTKKGHEEMVMTKLDVDVRIYGFLAETTTTMTFLNPHGRVLEGDIYFPLPEGSTVNGFALDIDGNLIDGVAVEKDRARAIFEKVVRQNIDPGLMEWTRGNTFKTRIFPIPSNGTRTIRVRYLSEVQAGPDDQPSYRLPLDFKKKVNEFHLRIEVIRPDEAPSVKAGGPNGLSFESWRSSFVAETSEQKIKLDEDLVIQLPAGSRSQVLVEAASDGKTYFYAQDSPGSPKGKTSMSAPKHLAIFWDASGSRAEGDHEREIEALDQCLGHWSQIAKEPIKVSVTFLRNRVEEGPHFTINRDDWEGSQSRTKLLKSLKTVAYDGSTNFDGIAEMTTETSELDRAMLFTDGLSNFGRDQAKSGIPIDVFSNDSRVDPVFMSSLAEGSGGTYFNLKELTTEQVIEGLVENRLTFRSIRSDADTIKDAYPRRARPVLSNLALTGILTAKSAELILTYATGDELIERPISLTGIEAPKGDMLRRYWAQTKLADLLPGQKRNRDKIVDLGKTHSLVTPFTSLLVLESLDQYLEHQVMPPASLPKVRKQYLATLEKLATAKTEKRASKLKQVLPMWEAFCEWHGQTFKYPKNFRYTDKEVEEGREAAAELPTTRNGGRSNPVAPGMIAPSSGADPFSDGGGGGGGLGGAIVDERLADKKGGGTESSRRPSMELTPWDPKTPYLAKLKKAEKDSAYETYLKLRRQKTNATSPAFFLDCSNFFASQQMDGLAVQVVSNLAELELENPQLLRVLAHRLQQTDQIHDAIRVFKQVLEMRPEEPQSYRDLALAFISRAESDRPDKRRRADYKRAIELLTEVVMRHWDRFEEIEIIALVEINRILPTARALGLKKIPLDKRLIKPIACDMRITMTWDADNTDIDLHVIEPSGEEAYYSHNRTTIGGRVSRDFTQGYGPEEYMLRRAMRGTYKVKANFYGSQSVKLLGGVTVQLNIYTNFGRPNQACKSITVRLTEEKDMIDIGSLKF